jgi:restriction system protein
MQDQTTKNEPASMVFDRYPPIEPSPEEFEKSVRRILDALGMELTEYQSSHREKIDGPDGEYEIDIAVRFSALGANYLTLVECERHATKVKREDVQILWSKMQSVGAQKGIMFATSGFQSGALEFAKAHGIALVTMADGRSSYMTRAAPSGSDQMSWERVPAEVPKIIGWLQDGSRFSLVSERHGAALARGAVARRREGGTN